MKKIISIIIILIFILTNIGYSLQDVAYNKAMLRIPLLSNSVKIIDRFREGREAIYYNQAGEMLGQIEEAVNNNDLEFYGESGANLFGNGKIVLSKELYRQYKYGTPGERLNAIQHIIHEIAETTIQVIQHEDLSRYKAIKDRALNHLAGHYERLVGKIPDDYRGDILANHIWATILEYRLMGIKAEAVKNNRLKVFLKEGYKILDTDRSLFKEEFNSLHHAKETALKGINNGMRFYRVASGSTRRNFLKATASLAIAIVSGCVQQFQVNQASSAKQTPLTHYFNTLYNEFGTSATYWNMAATPYIITNEDNEAYFSQAIKNKGGAMIGVSFDQNFSFAVHGDASAYIIVDINPMVTEVFVPFFGRLLELAPTRREFLSLLTGIDLSNDDVIALLEPKISQKNAPQQFPTIAHILDGESREDYLTLEHQERRLSIFKKIFSEKGFNHCAILYELVKRDIFPKLQVNDSQKKITTLFFDTLYGRYGAGLRDFIYYHAIAGLSSRRGKTWLSTEFNYLHIRKLWMQGKIMGMTSDIKSPSVARLSHWLLRFGDKVSAIYISNVEEYISEEGDTHLIETYNVIDKLPLREDALMLSAISLSPLGALDNKLIPHVNPYTQMRWIQNYVRPVGKFILSNIIWKPLAKSKESGSFFQNLYAGIKETMYLEICNFDTKIAQNERQRTEAEPVLIQKMQPYEALFELLKTPEIQKEVKNFNPHEFTVWVKKMIPQLDTDSQFFRAMVGALVEKEIIKPPSYEILHSSLRSSI